MSSVGIYMAISAYHSWREHIHHLFGTFLFAIYFWPISDRQFRKVVLLVLQQCGKECIVIDGKWTSFMILGCVIYLVDGGQCKCKRKQWFLIYVFLWTCQVTNYCQISSIGNCLPRTCWGHWRGRRWREKCQLGRCTNKIWGAQTQTHQQDFVARWFVDITVFFPLIYVFLWTCQVTNYCLWS